MYNAHLHVWPKKRRCYCVFAIFKREIGNVSIGCQILYTIVIIRVVSPSDSREARCSLSPLKFGPNCGVFDCDFTSWSQECFFFLQPIYIFQFLFGLLFPLFYLDFYIPFLFGQLFPFSIWTFIFIFYLDFLFYFLKFHILSYLDFCFLFLILIFYLFFNLKGIQ